MRKASVLFILICILLLTACASLPEEAAEEVLSNYSVNYP